MRPIYPASAGSVNCLLDRLMVTNGSSDAHNGARVLANVSMITGIVIKADVKNQRRGLRLFHEVVRGEDILVGGASAGASNPITWRSDNRTMG